MSKGEPMRVAYLVSRYPGISQTFIEREILGLRALGVGVETFSVWRATADHLLSPSTREEAARTTALIDGPRGALSWQLVSFGTRHLTAVLRTFGYALRLGERRARSRVYQLFYLAEAMLLVNHCRERGVRHIHVHFANNGADVARLAVRLGELIDGKDAGWGWSFTMHGPTEFQAVEAFDLPAKVVSASGVACISDFTRSQLMRLVDDDQWPKMTKIHMSVDTARYAPPPDARARRTAPVRILMVGRLVREKAPMILIEAVQQLVEQGMNLDVRVVGSGPLDGRLRAETDRRGLSGVITWLGPLGQDETLSWFHWADIFCLPSFQEGLPVVLMEAMATALPVVTTRIAGVSELVEDGETGEVVPAGRADLVAEALRRLADDPVRRREEGTRGRRTILESFTTERSAAEMRDFLVRFPGTASEDTRPAEEPVTVPSADRLA